MSDGKIILIACPICGAFIGAKNPDGSVAMNNGAMHRAWHERTDGK